MKVLSVIVLFLFLVGCSTNEVWEPKPTFSMTGEFDGEIVMYDPNQAPPEHPAWRIADRFISVLGPVALPYLVTREMRRSIQQPEVINTPEPTIVRPEVIQVPAGSTVSD